MSMVFDNRYKPFLRDKLWLSIYDSLKHRKTAINDATALTDTIIAKLYPLMTNGSFENQVLASITVQTLQHFDKAAATHYAAYHPLT